jgi:AraC family transcriptional regulator
VGYVSTSTGALRRIDFVEAMLEPTGIVPYSSATFEEPGAMGIACVCFKRRLENFKPPDQAYHGIGYRICGARTIRTDKPASGRGRRGEPGMTAIVPAEEESRWIHEGPHEMVHFYISSRFLAALAGEIYGVDGSRLGLPEAGFHDDRTVERYAMVFRDRLLDPILMTELELNAAAQLLGAHLLKEYSNLAGRSIPSANQKGSAPLSPMQLRRVRDYVRANLSRDMGLAELAEQAQLSPHYFSMRFKHTLGVSPHRYVLRERIDEAQRRLAARQASISEVALSLGFSDQSHFSQTFRKLTGTTPKRFKSTC